MPVRALLSRIGLGLLALAGLPIFAWGSPYTSVIVFGDSLSDVGNFYRATKFATPSALYYDVDPSKGLGRFSNGRLWVEYFASGYETNAANPLYPNFGRPKGVDYAWAYAEVAEDVRITKPVAFTVPSLPHQLSQYLTDTKGKADPNALYIIWGGKEDLIDVVEHAKTSDPSAFAKAIVGMVTSLKTAGATNFLIPTIPDIAYFPEISGLGLANSAKGLAHAYDAALNTALGASGIEKGITIVRPDIYYLQRSIIASLDHFNFNNVTDACIVLPILGSPSLCPTELSPYYFFWDGRNVSGFANSLLAGHAQQATPDAHGVNYP